MLDIMLERTQDVFLQTWVIYVMGNNLIMSKKWSWKLKKT